jgi:hypothetical protein
MGLDGDTDTLSAAAIADADPDALLGWFQGPPAVHRYPGSMAARTQALCRLPVERYDGRADAVWADAPDGATLLRRIGELPGSGAQKAEILVAPLGKQVGVTPPGWRWLPRPADRARGTGTRSSAEARALIRGRWHDGPWTGECRIARHRMVRDRPAQATPCRLCPDPRRDGCTWPRVSSPREPAGPSRC